jgi:subtilisin family serine protease
MARVIGKDELCIVDLKHFKALQGNNGKTLFDRYASLDNVIKSSISSNYQHFLAYPVKKGDSITFYGKAYKETPCLLSDLQGSEERKYKAIKAETISHFETTVKTLKDSGKSIEAAFIADAVRYVDDRFVYCYDDKVVLGVWGMQLRDNIREGISEIRKNLFVKKKKEKENDASVDPVPPIARFNVSFYAGEHGTLNGNSFFTKEATSFLYQDEIPQVEPKGGYEFAGWDDNPLNYEVTGDKEFTAQYKAKEALHPSRVQPPSLPWYRRFWNWLRTLFLGRGCLRWLLWLLLLLLLMWLLSYLFRGCNENIKIGSGALSAKDSTWMQDDPNVGNDGGIYDPHDPYKAKPTPPGLDTILPPYQGVLPPIEGNPEIVPGNPTVLANRLNILMENEDKSVLDLAKAFKTKYPNDKYKVVYYDDVVKRMQIEIPKEEREKLKKEIPTAFAPEYDLFVFDESLFESNQASNDPALTDIDKSWYLNAIKAPQAWGVTRGSEKITIAIVDNGFNLKHPELASKVVSPYNVWKHSAEVFPLQIDHGTHVAGIALAIADNGRGLSGIAPNCKFMPVQVATERGVMTTTSVLDGILYSLYQGADVINVSLGGQFTGLSQYTDQLQQDLIRNHFKEEERLWRRVMRIAAHHNATLVVAAGNDNVLAGIDALQRPELFITVSATDKDNRNTAKAQFSNYGSYATISAPGVGIYSTVGKDEYATMDGTSMAAPIVAGAVALMKSINNTITTKQIICILQSTGLETQGGIGKLIQLDKALQKVSSGERVDCAPVPSSGDVQILLSWNNYNDLDLICTDPNGESVFFKNRNVSSGGQLEIDMNVEYPDSQTPIENIFWEPGTAPSGTYNVYLLYYKKHEQNIDETPYSIKVKHSGKMDEYKGVISKDDKSINVCSFTVGTTGSRSLRSSPSANGRQSHLEQEQNRLQRELQRINNELRQIRNGR